MNKMDAMAVIAMIGGIALLIGIFGGGLKAKEVEIPKIPVSVRMLSSITGIILLGITVWLSIRSTTPITTPADLAFTPAISTYMAVTPSVAVSLTQSVPQPINSPKPTIDLDSTVYDNFDNPAFDGKWNADQWGMEATLSSTIKQKDGALTLSRENSNYEGLISTRSWAIDEIGFVEYKVMIDEDTKTNDGGVNIEIDGVINGQFWWLDCGIINKGTNNAKVQCASIEKYVSLQKGVSYNSWHTIRIETNPDTAVMTFFVDDSRIGTFVHSNPEVFKKTLFSIQLYTWTQDGKYIGGYIDDVRIGKK